MDIPRDKSLIDLANEFGVDYPTVCRLNELSGVDRAFVLEKQYDFARIKQFMQLSMSVNQHTNFGPVSRLLERALKALLNVPEFQDVLMVTNATHAIHLCMKYLSSEYNGLPKNNQNMDWITSAFTFPSSRIGQMSSALVVDCDIDGFLGTDNLLKKESSDPRGYVFTNTFASGKIQGEEFLKHLQGSDSPVIIDSATALFDLISLGHRQENVLEVVSFHHTKPWGVGEGGMILGQKHQIKTLRALINFGFGKDPITDLSLLNNFKISDLSCAAILDWLERWKDWSSKLINKEEENTRILKSKNFDIDKKIFKKNRSPRTFLPVVLNYNNVSLDQHDQTLFKKYYVPLADRATCPNAWKIFDRILCVSNNPEYESAYILNALKGISCD